MNKARKAKSGTDIVILVVGEKVFKTTRKMAEATIELGKTSKDVKGKNAIMACEKDSTIILKKDVYGSITNMYADIQKYQKDGYKVTYIKAKGDKEDGRAQDQSSTH